MMRWSVVMVLGALVAFGSFAAAESGAASVEALQAEIARLKEQLSKLEKQLSEMQKQQKATEKVTQRFEPITIGGYIQMRYERDDSRPTNENNLATGRAKENFRLRRVRLDVRGTPIRGVLYRLQADVAGTNAELRDAFLELRAGDGVFTFGHFKVPLLEEVIESSAVRWTPERARVSTVLFPGERDRGIAYTWRKQGAPEITLGLFSGTRTTQTQDSLTSRKSWLVRIVQPLDKQGKLGKFWVGRMDGIGRRNFGTDAAPNILNFDRERTVVGLTLTPISGLTIRGEWVDGKDFGTAANPTFRVRGWYALVGYKLPNQPFTLYAKYDEYDPNRDVAGNTFKRNALGIQYDLNRSTRMNLTWENQDNPDATIWTFQTQVRF
ncbi:MAG: porin [Armatimonadetes bacterium]|nr:porin [Armatimonadota bacterium]MDW8027376.1 porin [Armatimonadota bacterium]